MLYGIISDIHANLEATIIVKEFFLKKNVEKVIILGDVVGYGVNPEECLEIFDSMDTILIKGNHEEAIITGNYEIFTSDAKVAIEWTGKNLSEKFKKKFSNLKKVVKIEDFVICHGGLPDPLHFYTNSRHKAKLTFERFDFKYCFIGHTHFPMAFSISNNQEIPSIIAQLVYGTIKMMM